MRKARKPRERSRDGPSVRQVDGERIIAYTDALRQCFFEFSPRSTHSMTSIDRRRCPQPAFLTVESRLARSRDSPRTGRGPARISRLPRRAQRAHGLARLDPPSKRKSGMVPCEEPSATIPVYTVRAGGWPSGRLRTLRSNRRHTPPREVRAASPKPIALPATAFRRISPYKRARFRRSTFWSGVEVRDNHPPHRMPDLTARRASSQPCGPDGLRGSQTRVCTA